MTTGSRICHRWPAVFYRSNDLFFEHLFIDLLTKKKSITNRPRLTKQFKIHGYV